MFYCIHSKSIKFQFIYNPFSPSDYFFPYFRMRKINISIHQIVIISKFRINSFIPVLVFSNNLINSIFTCSVIKINTVKKVIIPLKCRIFIVSSRKSEFCPSFYFKRFRYFHCPIFRINFNCQKILCFVSTALMIQNRIQIHIYIILMKLFNCLNQFLFCPIFRSNSSFLIKFP